MPETTMPPVAGELDVRVAEEVMGWRDVHRTAGHYWLGFDPIQGRTREVPCYHRDLACAGEVIAWMATLGFPNVAIEKQQGQSWWVDFYGEDPFLADGEGETLPEAICRAALNALACSPKSAAAEEKPEEQEPQLALVPRRESSRAETGCTLVGLVMIFNVLVLVMIGILCLVK